MLITPPNDQATAYGTYWKYLAEHQKNSTMRCAKKCLFLILVAASSDKPTPELCFLSGRLR